jgi:KDO2-lipid IV(A) lauroyltransferase
MRDWIEFIPFWLLLRGLGILPRGVARAVGVAMARIVYGAHAKLRRVGLRNLQIAFPQMPEVERRAILKRVFDGMGRQLAEFAQLPRLTKDNIADVAVHDGLENFLNAQQRGKGVLLLTGHFGAWELGSFAHSLYGYPIKIVVRDLDNPLINNLVKRYRTLHGNSTFDNREFARGLISSMRAGDTVGILMDTNMTPPQGVFVDFFGVLAATASGMARVALKTDAAVVPAFTLWDEKLQKYRVRFEPMLDLVRSGDTEAEAVANTALFTNTLEAGVRAYPDQWIWVHRRWKTRPSGEKSLY